MTTDPAQRYNIEFPSRLASTFPRCCRRLVQFKYGSRVYTLTANVARHIKEHMDQSAAQLVTPKGKSNLNQQDLQKIPKTALRANPVQSKQYTGELSHQSPCGLFTGQGDGSTYQSHPKRHLGPSKRHEEGEHHRNPPTNHLSSLSGSARRREGARTRQSRRETYTESPFALSTQQGVETPYRSKPRSHLGPSRQDEDENIHQSLSSNLSNHLSSLSGSANQREGDRTHQSQQWSHASLRSPPRPARQQEGDRIPQRQQKGHARGLLEPSARQEDERSCQTLPTSHTASMSRDSDRQCYSKRSKSQLKNPRGKAGSRTQELTSNRPVHINSNAAGDRSSQPSKKPRDKPQLSHVGELSEALRISSLSSSRKEHYDKHKEGPGRN
jgi:hypothetical protein